MPSLAPGIAVGLSQTMSGDRVGPAEMETGLTRKRGKVCAEVCMISHCCTGVPRGLVVSKMCTKRT